MPSFPTEPLPEPFTLVIIRKEENVALADPLRAQSFETLFNQAPAQAAASMLPGHGEVVHITATAIVSAEHRAHQCSFRVACNKTQTFVPPQVFLEFRSGIRLVQPNALCVSPEMKHLIEIADDHWFDDVLHTSGESIAGSSVWKYPKGTADDLRLNLHAVETLRRVGSVFIHYGRRLAGGGN